MVFFIPYKQLRSKDPGDKVTFEKGGLPLSGGSTNLVSG